AGPDDDAHQDHGRDVSTDLAYAILAQLGRGKRRDDSLAISGGDDPVFKTPWRIAHAGSAALGAVGLAVSDLWRLRTGRPQAAGVARHAAAVAVRPRWAGWVSPSPICGGSGPAGRRPSMSTAMPPRCRCAPTPMCCRTASG